MSDEIRPAIHAMWWKEIIPRIAAGDGWVPLLSDYAGVKNSEGHAAAALALYGQPFGFTQADVDNLRSIPDGTGYGSIDDPEWFASLIERIAALLPP